MQMPKFSAVFFNPLKQRLKAFLGRFGTSIASICLSITENK